MNAIELLKQDHDKVRAMLDRLVQTSDGAEKTRADLLDKIDLEMKVHTQIEEEIFYPAFKDGSGKEAAKMYFEAKEEHRAVEDLVLPDIKDTEPTSNSFSGRAKVLKELIEHHVEEEEEDMFPKAREVLSDQQLEELGAKMMARKKELQQKLM